MAFRRESGVPKGGPSGGNGGKGGNVILVADPALDTLLDFSYRENYAAGRAGHGEGSNKTGKSGEDLRLPVPLGTVVREADTGERLGELLEPGKELIVARGGGSLEDLLPYNTERVARAIRAARVPVVSGVGHEIDVKPADDHARFELR